MAADLVPDAAGRSIDLLDARMVAASLHDCDAIIHCAAIPSPENIEPVELVRINTGTGPYEVLIIAANDTTSDTPTEPLVARFCQQAEVRRAFPGVSGVFDVSRAKDVIGWEPRSTWRRPDVVG